MRKDGRFQKSRWIDGKKMFGYSRISEEDALTDLEEKIQGYTLSTAKPQNETLHEFAKRVWFPSLEFIAPLSSKRYQSSYRTHVRPRLGAVPILELKKPVVQEFVYQMLRDDVPGPSIRYALERVAGIASLAIDHELIAANPCVKLKGVPKKTPKRERVLSVEKAMELLEGLKGTDLSAPVYLALVLGLRRGEIAALKWDHLDRQRGELKISKQRQAQSGLGVVEKDVKSESFRTQRLTREIIAQIDARGNLDSKYICTRDGEPWVPQTIYDDWLDVRKGFGLESWTVHDLRHGAAGLLFATGADLLEIAEVLGHSKPDMSLLYTSLVKKGGGLEKLSAQMVDK